MLPPQLRQGLVRAQRQSLATLALKATSTSLLRATPAHSQRRGCFFGWRRRSDDWTSHLDPTYHRFCRFRTLKTRAKLLKNLRRRGKFNWDFESKPFFTPQLVRWASHWDGKFRPRWLVHDEEAKKKAKDEEGGEEGKKEGEEEDGFELSPREKEWKEKMEAMRKRLEKDPYEAIFGKRFEPFWSPLVPSWMREEMGLQGWPKQKDTPTHPKPAVPPGPPEPEPTKTVKNETAEKAKPKEKEAEAESAKMETASADPKVLPEQKWTSSQPGSYSYASSTSWDSWTNRTRRVEWDSVSGQTRKYVYDPISNRMVQVEAPKPTAPTESEIKSGERAPQPTKVAIDASESTSKPTTTESKGVNIPAKQSSDLRKSIPIPPPLSQPSHSIPLGFSKMAGSAGTSIGPVKSTAIASDMPKPAAALTKLPEKKKDVDLLTADAVRASMGNKTKHPGSSEASKPVNAAEEEKTQIAADILNERDSAKLKMHHTAAKNTEQRDLAEMSVMLDKELESLQKKKEKLVKDERGLFHIERQKRELQKLDDRIQEVTARVEKMNLAAVKDDADGPKTLQSSLDRMQSKDLPRVMIERDDDSAAHESTEAIAALNGVPKNWAQQAELLQADRVRRTASSKRPYPMPSPSPRGRWIDDMQARKDAHEEAAAKAEEEKAADADRRSKLEKANAMLEAEVAEQKSRMQAHEDRYAHKIRGLRGELEMAYRQSTVHSEKHLERIRGLEEELGRVTKAAGAGGGGGGGKAGREEELKKVEEGQRRREVEKAEQKKRDRELVKEVREIYEGRYGVIDAGHRQPTSPVEAEQKKKPDAVAAPEKRQKQVVEVESDVDLGEALARYEREGPAYTFPKEQNLENQIARDEREYYEGQGPLFKTKIPDLAETTKDRGAEEGKKLVDDKMPKLIPTELTKPTTISEDVAEVTKDKPDVKTAAASDGIHWEEPPVYKVLAYDSGNDMMSTATTTSNFTGSEAPISIPQALSQLYQPARFVPYFAELQKEGYQVVFGSTDLLVFKKVKGVKPAVSEDEVIGLEDHGMSRHAQLTSLFDKAKAELGKLRSVVNPVDGTSKPPPPEPSTGNFASPTGFVNHDPVFPPEQAPENTSASPEKTAEETQKQQQTEPQEEEDIEWRHYPRVRRMEQHFTGSRRRWSSNHRRHKRAEERERDFQRKKKSTFKWILGAGLGSAAAMYVVGAAAERARYSKEDDWARKAEEQRKRWRGL